jgi:hypothetical protein
MPYHKRAARSSVRFLTRLFVAIFSPRGFGGSSKRGRPRGDEVTAGRFEAREPTLLVTFGKVVTRRFVGRDPSSHFDGRWSELQDQRPSTQAGRARARKAIDRKPKCESRSVPCMLPNRHRTAECIEWDSRLLRPISELVYEPNGTRKGSHIIRSGRFNGVCP